MNKEIKIPEGYEARIEGNKVILELKESENEEIRKGLIKYLQADMTFNPTQSYQFYNKAITYLEKQKEHKSLPLGLSVEDLKKLPYFSPSSEVLPDGTVIYHTSGYLVKPKEQKPTITIDQLKSFMLRYLQDAANRKDDSEIEADTDKYAKKILEYSLEQKPVPFSCSHENGKPAEWSKEDKEKIDDIIRIICTARECSKIANIGEEKEDNSAFYNRLVLFLKALKPNWKPSWRQIAALENAITWLTLNNCGSWPIVQSLIDDLKKL